MMKIFKIAALCFVCALMFTGSVHAEENELKGTKLGFGIDRGFGVVGATGQFNGFLGNDGVAVDYILTREKLDAADPLYWYVAGGGFVDWDGDFGARLPVGVEFYFAKNLDVYAQLIPRLRINNNDNNNNNSNKNKDAADFGLDFAIGVRYQF